MATSDPGDYDVIVIGGGPAGTTTATLVAQRGWRVGLFERERFPRYHIGESLIPQTFWVLEQLKMLPKLQGSPFVKKYSVQFVTEHGRLSEPFYFWDHKAHDSSQTWQVTRGDFDLMMLDNAREQGVLVHEGARVSDVEFEGDRAVGIRVRLADEPAERSLRASVIVDATGQQSLLMGKLGLRQWDPELKKAALWTYWRGAERDSGRDEGATLVIQTQGKKGWFWYIPLQNDLVSVGVVADHDYLFKNRGTTDFETIYFQEVARCPGLQPRIATAQRCDTFRAQKEYSYRSRRAAGDGWVLVGDALGFLDPLYSSGVLLALTSGQMAAEAIVTGLANGDTTAEQLGRWESGFVDGMERMRRLVREYYDGFSFGRFVRKHPHLKGRVTDVLIGDVFKDDVDVLWPLMDAMRAEEAKSTT